MSFGLIIPGPDCRHSALVLTFKLIWQDTSSNFTHLDIGPICRKCYSIHRGPRIAEESGIMTGSIVDFDQTVAGWHSYSAYDTKILDDSILGE